MLERTLNLTMKIALRKTTFILLLLTPSLTFPQFVTKNKELENVLLLSDKWLFQETQIIESNTYTYDANILKLKLKRNSNQIPIDWLLTRPYIPEFHQEPLARPHNDYGFESLPEIVPNISTDEFSESLLYPSVGALILTWEDAGSTNQYGICSGTLIGAKYFLTSAHCVVDNPCKNDPRNPEYAKKLDIKLEGLFSVYFEFFGLIKIVDIILDSDFNGLDKHETATCDDGTPATLAAVGEATADFAVLELAHEIKLISPESIFPINNNDLYSNPIEILGYGRYTNLDGTKALFGRKRSIFQGLNFYKKSECKSNNAPLDAICFNSNFDRGAATCSGDSGGPTFLHLTDTSSQPFSRGRFLIGTTTGGTAKKCNGGIDEESWQTNLTGYYNKFLQQYNSITSTPINPNNIANQNWTTKYLLSPTLTKDQSHVIESIQIENHTEVIHITVNGERKAKSVHRPQSVPPLMRILEMDNDIDAKVELWLTDPNGNGILNYASQCDNLFQGNFLSCRIKNPTPGKWKFNLISKSDNSSQYTVAIAIKVNH